STPINEKLIDKLGAEGMVAGASILRDSKKNRGIIGAAAVFMVVLIVTSFSSNLITKMVEKAMLGGESVYTTVDYDFGIVSDIGGQHEAQYEAIKAEVLADENVENIIEYYNGFHLARAEAGVYGSEYWNAVDKIMDAYGLTEEQKTEYGRTPTDEAIFLMAFDDATFGRIVNATDADASIICDESIRPAIIIQDGALTTDNYIYPGDSDFKFFEIEHMTDKQVGETFETYVYSPSEMDYKTFPLTVAGLATKEQLSEIFIEDSVRMCVIISRSTMEELAAVTLEENGAECEKNLLIKFRNTDCTFYSDLAQRTYDTENEYTPESIEVFRNVGVQAKSISDAITSAIRVLLVCFVVLTSLICMLNLFNSVRGKIAGRKMEFAALRSVGMTDHQFVKMLTLECGAIFAASAIAAIVVATPLIFLVRTVLVNLFGNLSTSIPFGMYLLAIALTAAALFLFTFFSFRAEKNKNILEDIRRESI
ncbi:MAG: FtsX-like permease family protein, partial [Clostridia bacterium]|nr:FtsX-like permease family protein [Clostridia bacterium]